MSQALLLLNPSRVDAAERQRNMDHVRALASQTSTNTNGITVRVLQDSDRAALERLAGRDSAIVPDGRVIGAEVDGSLAAVLSLSDGSVIADPFRPTSSAVELLRLRARQLGVTSPRRRLRLRGRTSTPKARGALAGSPPGASRLLHL